MTESELIIKANKGDVHAMRRLSSMYRDGKDVDEDLDRAIDYIKMAADIDHKWSQDFVDLLLRRGNHEDLKEVYYTCRRMENDFEWAKICLVRMYWNGIFVEKDRVTAKKIARRCHSFIHSSPVNPIHYFKDEVYSFDNIILYNDSMAEVILSSCIQNNLEVDYVYNPSGKNKTFLGIKAANEKDLMKITNLAIIISMFSYIRLLQEKNVLLEKMNFFVFTPGEEGGSSKYNPNSIFTTNTDLKNASCILKITNDSYILTHSTDDGKNSSIYPLKDLKDVACKYEKGFKIALDCEDWRERYLRLVGDGVPSKDIYVDLYKRVNCRQTVCVSRNCAIRDFKNLHLGFLYGKMVHDILVAGDKNCKYVLERHRQMGDEYKLLCRINKYHDTQGMKKKVIVGTNAEFLPDMFGYDGLVLNVFEHSSLIDYLLISGVWDSERFKVFAQAGLFSVPAGPDIEMQVGTSRHSDDRISKAVGLPPYTPVDDTRSIMLPLTEKTECDNAVLLNPYANFIKGAHPKLYAKNKKLFEELASALVRKGYVVYTNSIDEKTQPPLTGTKRLNLSIPELVSTCNRFKAIVSVDTGLTEVLTIAQCNLILINPIDNIKKTFASICNHSNYWEYTVNIFDDLSECIELIQSLEPVPAVKKDYQVTSRNIIYRPERVIEWGTRFLEKNPEFTADIMRIIINDRDENVSRFGLEKCISISSQNEECATMLCRMYLQDPGCLDLDKIAEVIHESNSSNIFFVDVLMSRGEPKDYEKAHIIVKNLANVGNNHAIKRLAFMYRDGIGTQKNLHLAIAYMRKATEAGNVARFELISLLMKSPLEADRDEAFRLCRKYIEEGSPKLEGKLAVMYRDGIGTQKDLASAIIWIRRAVEIGNEGAKPELISLLMKSPLEADRDEAFRLCRKYIEEGSPKLEGKLAVMYRDGIGTQKDQDSAITWMHKAAETGDKWAETELIKISTENSIE